MKEEISAGKFLKVGQYVRISSHKFPELHPKNEVNKSITKTPKEMEEIQLECNSQDEPIIHFRKNTLFRYKLSGLNYIRLEGVIIKIRDKAACEYENTGDVARYVIKIKSNLSSWKNKIVTLYPSQVEKIHKLTDKDIEIKEKESYITKKDKIIFK